MGGYCETCVNVELNLMILQRQLRSLCLVGVCHVAQLDNFSCGIFNFLLDFIFTCYIATISINVSHRFQYGIVTTQY